MQSVLFRGRRAAAIENDRVRLTMLEGGGHVAEILDKATGVNPLWIPHWLSIEPSAFDPALGEYGTGAEAKLLAGIMGHNICLDIFGGPSAEEAAAGLTVHGEAPVTPFEIAANGVALAARATLPVAQIRFERRIELHECAVRFEETIENLSAQDRPIGWTQHVTLGPPFLQKGETEFRASAGPSQVYEQRFGDHDYLRPGGRFSWPDAPLASGGSTDLRICTAVDRSSAYTAHLMDPALPEAFFVAFTPSVGLAFGYVWRRSDFPWLGIWEENFSRSSPPWNGATLARGMEFGVSPYPETRREMIDRSRWFDTPTFRWLPALSRLSVEYWAVLQHSTGIPEILRWPH
jgi:hypothetical protein